jgi:iron complex outermembrane receptor protein
MKYVTTIPLKVNDSKVTWLIGLNYKPSDRTLVFAKVSTGFKAGGFDSVGNYRPESNTAYELGWKQSFGSSGQHHVNLGAFYYNYKDLQVSVLLDTRVGGQTFNAGKATIWGLEASGDFELGPDTRFHGSINYLKSKFDQLNAQYAVFCLDIADPVRDPSPCPTGIGDLDPTVAGNQFPDFKGNSTPFSPKLIVTAGLEHVFHLGDGTLTGRVDTIYKTKYFTDYFNYNDGSQKGYTQTDLSLEYKPGGKQFSIQGFARNLEDNRPLTYGGFTAAGPDRVFNWQFGAPRTYGVRVGVDF